MLNGSTGALDKLMGELKLAADFYLDRSLEEMFDDDGEMEDIGGVAEGGEGGQNAQIERETASIESNADNCQSERRGESDKVTRFWEDTSIALGLSVDLVRARVESDAGLAQFTVVQLKTMNRSLCSFLATRCKSYQAKAQWISSTRSLVTELHKVHQENNQPEQSTPIIQAAQISLSDSRMDPLPSTPLRSFPVSGISTPEKRLSVKSRVRAHFAANSPVPQSPLSAPSGGGMETATPQFRNPLLGRVNTNSPTLALLTPKPSLLFSNRLQTPTAAEATDLSIGTSPSVWQASTTATPDQSKKASHKRVSAMGNSKNWKPSKQHYIAIAKLVKQIPASFHLLNDFSSYIHSESCLPSTNDSRQFSVSFYLTPALRDMLQEGMALNVYFLLESPTAFASPTFGLPAGTVQFIKIGAVVSKSVVYHQRADMVNLSGLFKENLCHNWESSPSSPGQAMTLTFLLPSSHLAPIHCLVIGTRQLSRGESVMKILQQEAVAKGLYKEAIESPHPPFWNIPQLSISTKIYQGLRMKLGQHAIALYSRQVKQKLVKNGKGEVEHCNSTVSFQCPISLVRMSTPGRGKKCNHVQSFDLETFIQMNEKKDIWKCPVCARQIKCPDISIDALVLGLMDMYPQDMKCILKADGSCLPWSKKNEGVQEDVRDTVEIYDSDDSEEMERKTALVA
ncbi:E3 SUMO-protein ligase pias1, partial [Chytriomyces hyalinus]